MFRVLMVPLDGFQLSEQALDHAVALAQRAGASIHLVHVLDLLMRPPYAEKVPVAEWWSGAALEVARDYLDSQAERVKASGVPVSQAMLETPIAPALLAAAQSSGADLIVMTTHGRGPLARLWIGSVADELGRRAPSPVLFVRATEGQASPAPSRFQHIVVPLDVAQQAENLLAPVVELARLDQSRLTLLHVVQPRLIPAPAVLPFGNDIPNAAALVDSGLQQQRGREYLRDVAEAIGDRGFDVVTEVLIAEDSLPAEILRFAGMQRADLIALPTRGHSGLRRLLLGSVADQTVRGAHTPVLVLRTH